MFRSVFSGGVIGKALGKGLLEIHVHDLRGFSLGKHRQVDDRPFGGGQGMVFKPEPIFKAVHSIRKGEESPVLLLSPQGRRFDTGMAESLARSSQLILICGRYEGVDERVAENLATDEVSIGDYILTGGEPAAVVVIDAVSRFVPDVVGNEESVRQDSFMAGMFDHPQYTRPRDFCGLKVPDVLFSGDHGRIDNWRRRKALDKTWSQRPELLSNANLSIKDKKMLEKIKTGRKGKNDELD